MSRRQEVQTEIRDTAILNRVCERNSIKHEIAPEGKKLKVELWDGECEGIAVVNLEGWNYPVVVKEDGTMVFDNHDGHWGDIKEVNTLLSEYGEEVVMHQLIELEGYNLQERLVHADGTVELTIGLGS